MRVIQQSFMMRPDSIAQGTVAVAALAAYWNEKSGVPAFTYNVSLGMPMGTMAISMRPNQLQPTPPSDGR